MDAKNLSAEQRDVLVSTLKTRFEKHTNRHHGIAWADVLAKLESSPEKLWSLGEMERTGGEPDVVGFDKQTGEYIFYDCVPETPEGRRNTCFDGVSQASREKKGVFPAGNVLDMVAAMGIDLLTEAQYRELQTFGKFDTKTSSWIATPADIRKLGGALFADYRYGHVFIYHNGAQSFYSGRGFRGALRV